MPIRIQIVTERLDPISAAIRFTTRSWASHAEFIDIDSGTTLGARCIGGVKIRQSRKDHYSRIEQFVVADEIWMRGAYNWAIGQIGKPYDFSAVAGIALNRNWRNDASWFCSELVAMSFEQINLPLLSTRQSDRVYRITPRDLLLSRVLIWIPTIK